MNRRHAGKSWTDVKTKLLLWIFMFTTNIHVHNTWEQNQAIRPIMFRQSIMADLICIYCEEQVEVREFREEDAGMLMHINITKEVMLAIVEHIAKDDALGPDQVYPSRKTRKIGALAEYRISPLATDEVQEYWRMTIVSLFKEDSKLMPVSNRLMCPLHL